ncbi:MAG TPA: hypothetical protein VJR89_43185, partial [Polyangiales bacterium]|nr:hypothetical protein [Polyangiales bacterium]
GRVAAPRSRERGAAAASSAGQPAEEPPLDVQAAPEPAAREAPAEQSHEAAAQPNQAAAPAEQSRAATALSETSESDAAPAKQSRAAAAVADDALADDADDAPLPLGFRVDAALLALHGYAPDLAPGVQLGAAGLLGAFSLHVAGRVGLPQTLHSPDGTARFALYAALIELCGSAQLGAGFAWQACGVAEPGVFTAAGEDTRNAKDYRRAWFALGGGTGLSFGLSGGFGLRAGAELLLPTRRDWALLAGNELYRVPAACLRLSLGLEARPW